MKCFETVVSETSLLVFMWLGRPGQAAITVARSLAHIQGPGKSGVESGAENGRRLGGGNLCFWDRGW